VIQKKKPVKKAVALKPAVKVAAKALALPQVIRTPYGKFIIEKGLPPDPTCMFPPKRPKIITIEGGEAHPFKLPMERGLRPDRVYWVNKDARTYTLVFGQLWPFKAGGPTIEVPGGGHSLIYTVWWNQAPGPYKYMISGSGPGEPEIDVGP